MKLLSKTIVASIALTMVALQPQNGNAQGKSVKMTNPLLKRSTLQYQAPPFNLIKDKHFKPAFEYGLKVHDAEIDAIASDTSKPTFQNTVLALELSGVDLGRATGIFYNLTGSNTNPTLQTMEEEFAPVFAAHSDKIYLNSKITVYKIVLPKHGFRIL